MTISPTSETGKYSHATDKMLQIHKDELKLLKSWAPTFRVHSLHIYYEKSQNTYTTLRYITLELFRVA